MTDLSKIVRVVDTDTHVIEPYDVWTSRVSTKRFGDRVPHVKWDEELQQEMWYFGKERIAAGAGSAMAGWTEYPPDRPKRLSQVDPAAYSADHRLKRMDEYGIYAQVLYPNIAGFGAGRYLTLQDPELMLLCVQAYNDWIIEWASIAPHRLLPQAAIPFWDLEASVKEMDRAAKLGHRGIIFCGEPEDFKLPSLTDPHWNPFWAAAEERGLPINFHIGAGDLWTYQTMHPSVGKHSQFAGNSINFFMINAKVISELTCGGICYRYPKLKFVSVESGVGWLPFAMEALDWQWLNSGGHKEHPEYKLLPSEFFRRQIYGSFWFERKSLHAAINIIGDDNVMYETDFPHPTSMSPGPATTAIKPSDYIQQTLSDLPKATVEKLLWGNAAKVYGLS